MSADTLDLDPATSSPQELRDHAIGRADAYTAHHNGTTLQELEARLSWLDDPRISGYTAAYLAGYRACMSDISAAQWWTRETQTDALFADRDCKERAA